MFLKKDTTLTTKCTCHCMSDSFLVKTYIPTFLVFTFLQFCLQISIIYESKAFVWSISYSPLHLFGQDKPSLTKFETQDLQKTCSQSPHKTESMTRLLHTQQLICFRIFERLCFAWSRSGFILRLKSPLVSFCTRTYHLLFYNLILLYLSSRLQRLFLVRIMVIKIL